MPNIYTNYRMTNIGFGIKKCKVVLLGDQSSGKTSIVTRFIYDTFESTYQATIGIDFLSKTITVKKTNLRLQLWDTAGQERFRSLMPSYIRDSAAALITYDITNRKSFENTTNWIDDVRRERSNNAILILVGNKMDLVEKRQVSYDEGVEHAKKYGMIFYETSAKEGTNIQNLFNDMGVAILESNDISTSVPEKLIDIDLHSSAPYTKKGCSSIPPFNKCG